MKHKLLVLFVVILFLLVSGVLAQGNGRFSLPWWTVDGGGGTSQSETFTLTGTIGQPDAQTVYGDSFTLTGGFWDGIPPQPLPPLSELFFPVAIK